MKRFCLSPASRPNSGVRCTPVGARPGLPPVPRPGGPRTRREPLFVRQRTDSQIQKVRNSVIN